MGHIKTKTRTGVSAPHNQKQSHTNKSHVKCERRIVGINDLRTAFRQNRQNQLLTCKIVGIRKLRADRNDYDPTQVKEA